MLERLQFSIPMSQTIAAPIDIVWDALTDLPSHPNMYSSVEKVVPIEDRFRSSFVSGSGCGGGSSHHGSQRRRSSSIGDGSSSLQSGSHPLKGTKWQITRRSVLENQRYTTKVTVTQCKIDEESGRRSFTYSTHEMLGATCSLKLIVEPVAPPAPTQQKVGQEEQQHSNEHYCQVTAIMTMIPYQFFVKLLGILCCLCLLKSRARMAMECDLEELAAYCEKQVQEMKTTTEQSTQRRNSLGSSSISEENKSNGSVGEQSQRSSASSSSEENEADAAGGGYQPQNNNLQPIVEEESSES